MPIRRSSPTLRNRGKLVKRENYLHSYPFCYRTHTPLIYRAMSCWYVDVTKLKQTMLDSNEQIYWMPNHLKHGRFGKWLEGARDWAISRNRFWGNPIPVWKCDNSDYVEVIGSIDELEKKSGVRVKDLHKHFVDDITWSSPDGKGTMRRIPDVLDCWFESGSMPYAQNHYPFENKEFVEEHFPADFICEGLDQTRGWFYTLVIIGSALFEKPAFYNCVTNGIVLNSDGKKMSKSLRNYTDPMEIVNHYGADALRFTLMNSAATRAEDLKFSEDGVKEVLKTLIIPLWNAYSFFVTYANIDEYEVSKTSFEDLQNPMDRWIVSLSQSLVEEVTQAWDAYETQKGTSAIVSFIDSLNNWYIRRSRRRFWRSENDVDKKQAYDTLYKVLQTVVAVGAPVIPFTTEEIYRNLRTREMEESVHLSDFPIYREQERDTDLERQMAITRQAITMGRSLRSIHNLKIRQPLSTLYLVTIDDTEREILSSMSSIIKEELNVKNIMIQKDESSLVTYDAKANFKVLGKQLGKSMKEVASLISSFSSETIENLLKGESYSLAYSQGEISISIDDIIVSRNEMAHKKIINEGQLTVGFDTEITRELYLEGIARDIVRGVQNLRKEKDFDVSDRIHLSIQGNSNVNDAVALFGEYISRETLAQTLNEREISGSSSIPCGDEESSISIERI